MRLINEGIKWKKHNDGETRNTAFPTKEPTGWADNHIAIQGIYGIGRDKDCMICGGAGTKVHYSFVGQDIHCIQMEIFVIAYI